MRPTRYAHIEGFTDLCYSEDGKFIITCGQDGDIRIFEGLDDDDCKTHSIADSLHAIVYRDDSLLVGSDMNMVHSFTFDEGESNGIFMRFTATPTHIQLSKDKNYLAAGSSDMTIKILDEKNFKETLLEGHAAPVLSIAFDPSGEYLASSSCDGTVKIWSMQSHSQVETLSILPKSNDLRTSFLCRLTWTANGKHLVIPLEKELLFYKRDQWQKDFSFKSEKIDEPLSIATLSPCGKYVATAGKGGLVAVWDLTSKSCILAEKHPKQMTITGLAWNPKGKPELAFVNDAGELGTVENFIGASVSSREKATSDVSNKLEQDIFPPLSTDDLQLEGNEDEEDAEVSIAKIKSQLGFADDEEGTFVGLPSAEDSASRPSSPTTARVVEVPVAAKLPDPQTPFQPGMSPDHLEERYMLWNNIGIIRQYNNDTENSIEVEFHDSSVHHALHLNNHFGHSVAALSSQALALAAESQEDQASKLVVDHFDSWDGNKEWSLDMPTGEDILALGIGAGWIAAATDKRNLRIFSLSGVQRHVLAIPGPIVCLAGHEGHLFIIFHSSIGVGGEQCMSAMVLNLSNGKHILPKPSLLPLSPKSYLSWAGFSDEGTPLIMDSAGVVRILQRKLGDCWATLLDTKSHTKGKSDNYFLLGASELQGTIRCILCKGSRYPPLLPKPHISMLDLQIPLCDSGSEKVSLEDKMIRNSLLIDTIDQLSKQGFDVGVAKSETEKLLKETMIKLFAMACRSEQEARGFDICQLMPSYQVVNLAIKYAGKLGRIHLANRLGELAEQKMNDELSQLVEQQEEVDNISRVQSSFQHEPISQENDGLSQDYHEESEYIKENPFLASSSIQKGPAKSQTLTPTPARNPFRRSVGGGSGVKGISGLDSFKPQKKNQDSHILRPVLKKPKSKQTSLQKASFSIDKEVSGKENKQTTQLDTTVNSSAPESPKTPSGGKKQSALQLWFQDHRESVKEKYPDVPEAALLPKAAMLFKDVEDSLKQKYRSLAAEANERLKEIETPPLPERKRKPSDETTQNAESESPLQPEKKAKSVASKLSLFSFNKKD